MKSTFTKLFFALAACGLAGCGGSGSGGGGGGGNQTVQPFTTVYQTYGLDIIDPYGFYGSTAGGGVTVAILDTGVAEVYALGGSGAESRVVSGCRSDGPTFQTEVNSCTGTDNANGKSDDDGHGTWVAGVVAGYHPEDGWQGIAPEAEVMAIDTYTSEFQSYLDIDIARGIRFAADNGANVINMSLGCSQAAAGNGNCPISPDVEAAMEYATDQGVAIVISAGNDGNGFFVGTDAALAGDPDMNGLVLAVGSIGPGENVSSFSNSCTSNFSSFDQEYCLVAPGENIQTSGPDGSTVTVSGTSFSAPYVSGAIALLMSADPTLSAADAIQIILMTAEDPTAPAMSATPSEEFTDDLYGNGILNLTDALAPVGPITLSVDATEEVGTAGVSFSQPFGDALQNSDVFDDAVLFDMFDRKYVFDLTKRLESVSAEANTNAFHDISSPVTAEADASVGAFNFKASFTSVTNEALATDQEALDFVVTRQETDKPTWYLGFSTSGSDFQTDPGSIAMATLNLTDTYSSQSLVDSSSALRSGLGWQKGKTEFKVSMSYLDTSESVELSSGLKHNFAQRSYAVVQFDYLSEENSFLGSEGTGGAEESYSADTLQMTVGLGWSLGQTDYYASYMHGRSDVDVDGASLFSSINDIAISALSFSAAKSNIWTEGDRFGFSMGMPTRLVSGSAGVEFESETGGQDSVSLKPSGTQKNLEFAYQTPLSDAANLQVGAAAMFEPGHDADAATDYAIGLKLTTNF
ncbi:MAG: S8 family serine peptidase [Pseudomonadota bacterium]